MRKNAERVGKHKFTKLQKLIIDNMKSYSVEKDSIREESKNFVGITSRISTRSSQ